MVSICMIVQKNHANCNTTIVVITYQGKFVFFSKRQMDMLDNGPSNGLKVARKLIWQWKHMVFLKRWSDMLDDGPTNGLIESG